jgi:hypothetical protein
VTIDGFGLVIGFIGLLKLVTTIIEITALLLIHRLYSSPQHALSLLSLLCFHRLSPGNCSQRRSFLRFRVPRLRYWLAGAYRTTHFTVFSIPHALTAHGLHFLTPDLRLYCSAHGLLPRAQDLLHADLLPLNSKLSTLNSTN